MGNGRKAVAVDLDGTLVRGNTLHLYILSGLKVALRRGKLLNAAKICALLAKRALRLISHTDMKFGCADLIGGRKRVLDELVARVNRRLDPDVMRLLNEYVEQGCQVVIATAALDFYVAALTPWPSIATRYNDNAERKECRGTAKASAVKSWIAERGYALEAVVTDHADDLPLLALDCKDRVLAHPSRKTLNLANKQCRGKVRVLQTA